MTKVLAVDPGYERCGVCLIKTERGQLSIEHSDCITTKKSSPHEERLACIFKSIETLIKRHSPTHIALETLFFSVNKKTAIRVAEARGTIVLLSGLYNIPLVEIAPQTVKIALTGVGNAKKEQVEKMVRLLFPSIRSASLDDEIDAVALGVAACGVTKKFL